MHQRITTALLFSSLLACQTEKPSHPEGNAPPSPTAPSPSPPEPNQPPGPEEPPPPSQITSPDEVFQIETILTLNSPWAMSFLPNGQLLVTEKPGSLLLVDPEQKSEVAVRGVPSVVNAGQGGLGDVVLHPDFPDNQLVYLSSVERADAGSRAVVHRFRLVQDGPDAPRLEDAQVIWRQSHAPQGSGHFSHRLAFDAEGYLFISSGERQEFTPSQDQASNLGKIVRLQDDGTLPSDNPFQEENEVTRQIWTWGHRNPLGLAFDAEGRLWSTEMGPRGGDELNWIQRGKNYGYPEVSEGDHYNGDPIPRHATRPEFQAPLISWTPVISPSSLLIYSGGMFPEWQGDAFIGGLSSQALIRVTRLNPASNSSPPAPYEAQRFPFGARIREVEQGPDGSIYLLEDGPQGRLLRLSPRTP